MEVPNSDNAPAAAAAAASEEGKDASPNSSNDEDMESIDGAGEAAVAANRWSRPAAPIPIPDPSAWRMQLSETEIAWARIIRGAVVGDWNKDNLPDFHHAQLALIDGADTPAAEARAMHWQHFRDQYKVTDNYEEGCQCLRDMFAFFPGVFLSMFFSLQADMYCLVYDITKIDMSTLNGQPDGFEVLLRGLYYLIHALCMDMESIRKGTAVLIDCKGFDGDSHISSDAERRIWEEVMGVFPIHFPRIEYVNAGAEMNVLISLKKEYLSRRITDKIVAQRQTDGRLSDVYLVPTPEAASQRLLADLEKYLKRRYENQKRFKIPFLFEEPEPEPEVDPDSDI